VVDWLDLKLFELSQVGAVARIRRVCRLLIEACWNGVFRRSWCGFSYYRADPAIHQHRYLMTPPLPASQAGDVTVVHHAYVIPRMLQRVAALPSRIVSVVHNNYEREIASASGAAAAWKMHCVAVERLLAVPRFATSEGGKDGAQRVGLSVDRVIHGGVNRTVFYPSTSHVRRQRPRLTVTLYCSLHPQKGQRVAIEALRPLQAMSREQGFRLCSLGQVLPEHAALFEHHYGYIHGPAYVQAMQETDIFVYPSLFDGFPAPPLEAMACGAAVVTTAVEGVNDYAEDGTNCLLCEPGNADIMRQKVLQLLTDPVLRERVRYHGLRTAAEFDVEQSAKKLLAFLEELCAAERPTEVLVSA